MEITSFQMQNLRFITKQEKVVKGKTDDKGIAKFEKLPFGKYTYKETVAQKVMY